MASDLRDQRQSRRQRWIDLRQRCSATIDHHILESRSNIIEASASTFKFHIVHLAHLAQRHTLLSHASPIGAQTLSCILLPLNRKHLRWPGHDICGTLRTGTELDSLASSGRG